VCAGGSDGAVPLLPFPVSKAEKEKTKKAKDV
jgi:hypothetical protein